MLLGYCIGNFTWTTGITYLLNTGLLKTNNSAWRLLGCRQPTIYFAFYESERPDN